jgi:aromatic ring-cleaving dioxygenase
MQKEKKKKYCQRSMEDRRKVNTFLLHERRVGPFCRRHPNAALKERKRAPKYWDWRLGQWLPLR